MLNTDCLMLTNAQYNCLMLTNAQYNCLMLTNAQILPDADHFLSCFFSRTCSSCLDLHADCLTSYLPKALTILPTLFYLKL